MLCFFLQIKEITSQCQFKYFHFFNKTTFTADVEEVYTATQSTCHFSLYWCGCTCLLYLHLSTFRLACADRTSSHLLTSCGQEGDVTVRNIYLTHYTWSHDFESDLENRKTGRTSFVMGVVMVVGVGTWCLTLQKWRTDIHTGDEGSVKKTVTHDCHTSYSGLFSQQPLHPLQHVPIKIVFIFPSLPLAISKLIWLQIKLCFSTLCPVWLHLIQDWFEKEAHTLGLCHHKQC